MIVENDGVYDQVVSSLQVVSSEGATCHSSQGHLLLRSGRLAKKNFANPQFESKFGLAGIVVKCDESKFNHRAKVSNLQKEISTSFNLPHYICTGCSKGE